MSKKRFTFADGFKIVAIRDNEEIMNSIQVCNKLNELNEENINLHIQNDFLKDEHQHMRDLVNENKQLKEELEQCKAVIDNRWSEYLKKKELEE